MVHRARCGAALVAHSGHVVVMVVVVRVNLRWEIFGGDVTAVLLQGEELDREEKAIDNWKKVSAIAPDENEPKCRFMDIKNIEPMEEPSDIDLDLSCESHDNDCTISGNGGCSSKAPSSG